MATKIKIDNSVRGRLSRFRTDVFTPAQIAILARQIALYLPKAAAASAVGAISFSRKSRNKGSRYVNPIVVDTSVFVDGRLPDVMRTGFIFGTLLVIPAVVSELHTLSDSSDDLKRARGSRGLDILKVLQAERKVKLQVLEADPVGDTVDDKLVNLGRSLRAKVMTLDFNLNKVASVRGVSVLNLNELAAAVKTAVLPHETLTVQVKGRGKSHDQGVAYLADGTMVVVEGGAKLLGKTVSVDVQRVIQTAAGKMIFGKISNS